MTTPMPSVDPPQTGVSAWLAAAIAAAVGLAVAAGCGASKTSRAPQAARSAPEPAADGMAAEAPAGPYDREKDDIAHYYMQIRSWRVDLGLGAEPTGSTIQQSVQSSVKKLRVCPDESETSTTQCKDVCNIKDAICDNAEQICRIAEDLAGDVWATEKCNSGKASCQEAAAKCCECAARDAEGTSTRQPCAN